MSNEELVKALRYCAESGDFNCNKDCPMYPNYPKCLTKMDMDAAAAIEDLQAMLTEADKKQAYQHDYVCELVAEVEELKAQLPKRGEWTEENRRPRSSQFVCSVCHRTAYDPQPTRDKAWRKRCRYAYCPNCGAKMGVPDGDEKGT